MTNTHTVAVVQAAPKAFDTPATMAMVHDYLQQAAQAGAHLVVFPEAFLGAYPKGLDFGARVGSRSEAGRDEFARYHAAAIDEHGDEVRQLCEWAQSYQLSIVMGCVERDGGTLYCTVLFIDEQGRYLGKHRKLMPTAMERLIWGFGDGSTLTVVDTAVGKTGAVICWENYMPLLRTAMYAQGVQIYCAPTVDDRESWLPSMRHIAVEGRCFVLSACQFAKRSDYPADYDCIQGQDPDTVLIRGGSCIVNPFGDVLTGPLYNESGLLLAEVDLNQIPRGQYDLDTVGHYARPDVFRLQVNCRPQQAVQMDE